LADARCHRRHDDFPTGARIPLNDRNAIGAQKWTVLNGAPVSIGSGVRREEPGGSPAYGMSPQVWTCTNAVNQARGLSSLDHPAKKDVAMQLVSAAANASLDWRATFGHIEDLGGGRGYIAGIVGFRSDTGDMLTLVEAYAAARPSHELAAYLPALRAVRGMPSHSGLDRGFQDAWRAAAGDPVFRIAQETERDRVYFNPSVGVGRADGLRALGQFAYYDAAVVHGFDGMHAVRARTLRRARPPSRGGDERVWLDVFLDERVLEIRRERVQPDTSRIDTVQRVFLADGNVDLNTPLDFAVCGDPFHIG
jgi:chitosanase